MMEMNQSRHQLYRRSKVANKQVDLNRVLQEAHDLTSTVGAFQRNSFCPEERHSLMQQRLKTRAIQAATVLAVSVPAFFGLSLWNKSDYCLGWAAHYMNRSVKLEADLLLAVAEHRQQDAVAISRLVRTDSLIAQKYLRVSRNPLLPYPTSPLVTEAELRAGQLSE